jgi:hypothetical protein
VAGNRGCDALCKDIAIDGESTACRHGGSPRTSEDQRAQDLHLTLEQSDRVTEAVPSQRVRTHEFGELISAVDRSRSSWPHLCEHDVQACLRQLPARLAAGESTSDHKDL